MDLLRVWGNVVQLCTTEKPEWTKYAELNEKRAYFGLLSRLALNQKTEDDKYKKIEQDLLFNLKKNEKDLLKSNMPIGRKIVLFCMCRNYSITKYIIRLVHGLYHHKE